MNTEQFLADQQTYFATALICAVDSFPLNAGIAPPPNVTWCAATAVDGLSWSRLGPIVPVDPV